MTDFDYLIDDLSDEAFEFCVDNIYDVLNFKSLKREDVRRIDLKEKFNCNSWQSEEYLGRNYMRKQNKIENNADRIICEIEQLNDYADLLIGFTAHMKYISESLASKYIKKADEIIHKIKILNDLDSRILYIEDLVTIFTWLVRSKYERKNNEITSPDVPASEYIFKEINTSILNRYDLQFIKRYLIEEKNIPFKYDLKTNSSSTFFDHKAEEFEYYYHLSYNNDEFVIILNFVYICSVIFLCRIIQKTTGFSIEENNDNGYDGRNNATC